VNSPNIHVFLCPDITVTLEATQANSDKLMYDRDIIFVHHLKSAVLGPTPTVRIDYGDGSSEDSVAVSVQSKAS